MCLTECYWVRLDRIVFANTKNNAAAIGFDDAFFYEELGKRPSHRSIPMESMGRTKAIKNICGMAI